MKTNAEKTTLYTNMNAQSSCVGRGDALSGVLSWHIRVTKTNGEQNEIERKKIVEGYSSRLYLALSHFPPVAAGFDATFSLASSIRFDPGALTTQPFFVSNGLGRSMQRYHSNQTRRT